MGFGESGHEIGAQVFYFRFLGDHHDDVLGRRHPAKQASDGATQSPANPIAVHRRPSHARTDHEAEARDARGSRSQLDKQKGAVAGAALFEYRLKILRSPDAMLFGKGHGLYRKRDPAFLASARDHFAAVLGIHPR